MDELQSKIESSVAFRNELYYALSGVIDSRKAKISKLQEQYVYLVLEDKHTDSQDVANVELEKIKSLPVFDWLNSLLQIDERIKQYSQIMAGREESEVFPD